jgi:hypothetical protein
MHVFIHAYIRTYTHTYVHTCIHTSIHTCIYAGMTTYDGILYVAEQGYGEILSFDINSEKFLMKIVDGKGGLERVEQIVLSTC